MNNEKVLRASRIGHPCDRNLWYSVQNAEEITNEKSKRIFELGRILEPVIINWLRQDGWKVRRNPIDSSNEGISLSISVDGGIISAHPDCLISDDDSRIILADIKTMNDRAFRSLKRDGTVKAFPNYADQLTIYAQAMRNSNFQVDKLAIVALNKNDCEGHIDFFDFDPKDLTLSKNVLKIFSLLMTLPIKERDFKIGAVRTADLIRFVNFAKKILPSAMMIFRRQTIRTSLTPLSCSLKVVKWKRRQKNYRTKRKSSSIRKSDNKE